MNVFNPSFTINIVSKPKKHITSKNSNSIISRKCLAIVSKIDDEYKAIINYDASSNTEKIVIPFTKKSLELKNKEYVWLKDKDEYGHNVCIIRDSQKAFLYPGLDTQYNAIRENLLIAGHIVRIDGKMYFEYETLIAFNYKSNAHINDVKIDYDKPLFNK